MDREPALVRFIEVLKRNWPLIVATAFVTPAIAVGLSLAQPDRHEAIAEVLISRQNFGAALTGSQDLLASQDPRVIERNAQTQQELARLPLVARRTLVAAGVRGRTAQDLLDASSVQSRPNSDLMVFSVEDGDKELSKLLATEYGRQFAVYRAELDTRVVAEARSEASRRLSELRAAGDTTSDLYRSLSDSEQRLSQFQTLQTSNAQLVKPAETSTQVQPRPVRSGVFGLLLGLTVGIGLAFLRETLDTAPRDAAEVGRIVGAPVVGRVGPLARAASQSGAVSMLVAPRDASAEDFRSLKNNLDFVAAGGSLKVVLVTSAEPNEGKSTTASNLAVAMARAGRHVVLLDLDLRKPALARLFGIDADAPGVTNVALGQTRLESALNRIELDASGDSTGAPNTFQRASPSPGSLRVLSSGPLPPDPGEFASSASLARLLASASAIADIVLLDSPPTIAVGDALSLTRHVDGVLVVSRLETTSRKHLEHLSELLGSCPAPVIGVVAITNDRGASYGYSAS